MKAYYQNVGLKVLCGLFGKSRQAYYKQIQDQERQALEEEIVLELVKSVRKKIPGSGGRKLYHKIKPSLAIQNIQIGRDSLFSILFANNMLIKKRKRYTKTTYSHHWLRKYTDLTIGLKIEHSEQLWVSDITYIRLKTGFCYLALITDAYSKKIVGWALRETLETELCIIALMMAIEGRKRRCELIHHSDRGVQYCSGKYVEILAKNDIKPSMTQNGSPYENALAERSNGFIKVEFECDVIFENFEAAYQKIEMSIHNYNTEYPHGSLDFLTPEEAELKEGPLKKRW